MMVAFTRIFYFILFHVIRNLGFPKNSKTFYRDSQHASEKKIQLIDIDSPCEIWWMVNEEQQKKKRRTATRVAEKLFWNKCNQTY